MMDGEKRILACEEFTRSCSTIVEEVTVVEQEEVFGSMSARFQLVVRMQGGRRVCGGRVLLEEGRDGSRPGGLNRVMEQPKEERNGAGCSNCFISHPCWMIGEEVTAAE